MSLNTIDFSQPTQALVEAQSLNQEISKKSQEITIVLQHLQEEQSQPSSERINKRYRGF